MAIDLVKGYIFLISVVSDPTSTTPHVAQHPSSIMDIGIKAVCYLIKLKHRIINETLIVYY